jgi:hypothetical protein
MRRSRAPAFKTLAYALTDSPLALAAWLVETFRGWTDCGGDLDDTAPRIEVPTRPASPRLVAGAHCFRSGRVEARLVDTKCPRATSQRICCAKSVAVRRYFVSDNPAPPTATERTGNSLVAAQVGRREASSAA